MLDYLKIVMKMILHLKETVHMIPFSLSKSLSLNQLFQQLLLEMWLLEKTTHLEEKLSLSNQALKLINTISISSLAIQK